MKLQWILLALFLMAMVNNIAKAMCNPMLKNVLRLISIPVAFIITFILQVTGVFRAGIDKLIELIPINEWLPEYAGIINEGVDFLTPFLCTLLGAFVFTLAFGIILFLLNTIHTNLIYKFIVRRQRKKEIKEFRLSLKEENERVRESIRESEERIWNAVDEAVDENPDHPVYKYEPLDDDEIERMVEEKIKKDKKRKKKMNFFKESGEHKAISIVCGVVSGFLLFGISWMGFFYTMDVLSDATSGIHDTDAVNTKIYKFAEMLDEHVVAEYEECFVYELYDGMAMIDLTNYTIRAGGKIEVADGSVSYADDIMRKYMKHAVRLACEVTDATSNQEHIGEDVEVLLKDPTMVSLLAKGVIVFVEYFESQNPDLFDSWENPPVTDGEVDLIAVLMGDIIRAYKNDDGSWSAESVENDFNAIVDVVVIAAENKLLANIIANSVDWNEVLNNKQMIQDMLVALSGVSFYPPVMNSVFTIGIDMIGEMIVPADNAAGYEAFVNNLVNTLSEVELMSDEDKTELYKLWTEVGAYTKNKGKIDYIQSRINDINERINALPQKEAEIAELDALISEGLATDEQIQRRDELSKEVESFKSNLSLYEEDLVELAQRLAELQEDSIDPQYVASIWDYLLDPVYVVEFIKDDGLDLKADADELMAQGNELQARADELTAKATALKNKADRLEELLLNYPNLSDEEQEELNALKEEQEALSAEGKSFLAEAEELENEGLLLAEDGEAFLHRGEKLMDDANSLAQYAEDSIDAFQHRFDGFKPFIDYFTTWMNVQKPFMVANEDQSTACMTIDIDGIVYVCSTDVLNLKSLLEVANSLSDFDADIGRDVFVSGEGEDIQDKIDHLEEIDLEADVISKIDPNLQQLLKDLTITSNLTGMEGRISELTDLVDYLVDNTYASGDLKDKAWLMTTLEAYIDGEADTSSEKMAKKIVDAKDAPESFDYLGVTVEHMHDALKFGKEWTLDKRKEDTEHLTEIVFTLIDLIKNLGGAESILPEQMNNVQTIGEGDESDITAILDMLKTFGQAMDHMAETSCLGELPDVIFEAILKNEKLSVAITPATLYGENGYVSKLESGELTYEELMVELSDMVKSLLDTMNEKGGNAE